MTITIHPVNNKHDLNDLLLFPWKLYRSDPLWVPPLLPSMFERFNPDQNPVIASGKTAAFIARDGEEIVGTIAVAVDEKRNQNWGENRAIFGFFECVENYAVAEMLFQRAVSWAKEQGMSSLWGPWYFDYEDAHGFLIGKRDHRPALMCAHNQDYYATFAERFGMTKARRDSLAFITVIDKPLDQMIPAKLIRVAEKVRERSQITIRTANLKEFDRELELVTDVLNRGLAVLDERGFWDIERMKAHALSLKPILDPDLIVIAEVEGRAVGWIFGLPDLNEAIASFDGLRARWKKPFFTLALTRRPAGASLKSIAVDPEYWNRGVDALLIYEFARNVLKKGYTWLDMSLTGEDNPMTPRLATNLGASEYKRYRIYEIGW